MTENTPFSNPVDEYNRIELQTLINAIPPEERTDTLLKKIAEVAKSAGTQYDSSIGLPRFAQAFKAISYVIGHTKDTKSHTPADIIDLFDQLFSIKSTTSYEKHSVGIEIELGSEKEDNSQRQEIRLGPFTDIESAMKALRLANKINGISGDNAISTLHLNFGLNEQQKSHLVESEPQEIFGHDDVQFIKKPYRSITEKLGYISNSAARNIKIAGNYTKTGLPHGYYLNNQYRGDFVKTDIKPVGDNGQFHDQVARLECKGFCLAHDAHFDMLKPFIGAMWKAIDDPAQAETLDKHLSTIFTDANITPLHAAMPELATLWSYDKTSMETNEETRYKLDFGLLQPILNEKDKIEGWDVIGRQVSWRPVIQDYLNSFVYDKEPKINKALYTPPDELQYYAEEMKAWEETHPNSAESWVNKLVNESQQIAPWQPSGTINRGS